MFQPTQILQKGIRRLRLTTKQAANKGGYYKGNRTGSMGWHTKHGGYIIDRRKVRTYVAPANLNEKLRPFIAEFIELPKSLEHIKKRLKADGQWSKAESDEMENASRLQDELDAMGRLGRIDGEKYFKLWKEEHLEQQLRLSEEEEGERNEKVKLLLPDDRPDSVVVDRMNWEMRERDK